MLNPLDSFLPAVQTWFRGVFDQPTLPQSEGWPAIQRGDHTLILSPTGSGKTLAAFLWGIDELYREMSTVTAEQGGEPLGEGVRLLYISPLKALNNVPPGTEPAGAAGRHPPRGSGGGSATAPAVSSGPHR
ncbi:DEAD/DEAH box helicase [Chloroflexota bacterium]